MGATAIRVMGRAFHLGQPCPQRASGRARALHGVFREEGLAMNSLHVHLSGMSSFLLHFSVWECVCGHPSHLPALCWAIRSGTLGKAPLV